MTFGLSLRWPHLCLVAGSAALCVLVAIGTPDVPEMVAPAPQAPLRPARVHGDSVALLSAIRARPIFELSRRQTVPAAPPPAPPPPPPPAGGPTGGAATAAGPGLTATLVTPTMREAVLSPSPGARGTRARPGQQIDGWVIETVEPDKIILQSGDERHEIRFSKAEKTPKKGLFLK